MNLIIDVGNSFVKLAVYKASSLEHRKVVNHDEIVDAVVALKKQYPTINRGIISSVRSIESDHLEDLKKELELLVLNSEVKLPFKNKYKTPKTLGVDRIALVSASVKKFPDENVLIIDAGTCITYDFINTKNEYLGGAISPGLNTRYKSLNNLTANLPLLEIEMPENIIGQSTSSSIHSGVVNGVLKELDGVVEAYKLKYLDLTVILTGGDANFLSKQLKSSIFAHSNFLLEGLNYILQFNSDE